MLGKDLDMTVTVTEEAKPKQIVINLVDDSDENQDDSMDESDEIQIDSENDDILCPYEKCEYKFSSERVLQLHNSLLHEVQIKEEKENFASNDDDQKVNDIYIKEPKLEPNIEFDAENPNIDPGVIVLDPLDLENTDIESIENNYQVESENFLHDKKYTTEDTDISSILNKNHELEEDKYSNDENHIEKVLTKQQCRKDFDNELVESDANFVSKYVPNTNTDQDISIDCLKFFNTTDEGEQLVEDDNYSNDENQIDKVLQRNEDFDINLVESDLNTVSKSIPKKNPNQDISIDMLESSESNTYQEGSTNFIDVWCKRCEMMVNPNHRKLCEKFANLAVKDSRGETKCYFCDMRFKFKNKAYYHIKMKHFAKKVVIICKKLSDETLVKFKKIPALTKKNNIDEFNGSFNPGSSITKTKKNVTLSLTDNDENTIIPTEINETILKVHTEEKIEKLKNLVETFLESEKNITTYQKSDIENFQDYFFSAYKTMCEFCNYKYKSSNKHQDRTIHWIKVHFIKKFEDNFGNEFYPKCPFDNCNYQNAKKFSIITHVFQIHDLNQQYFSELKSEQQDTGKIVNKNEECERKKYEKIRKFTNHVKGKEEFGSFNNTLLLEKPSQKLVKNFKNVEQSEKIQLQVKHHKKRNYKYDSCGRTFIKTKYLKRHICSIHEGQKTESEPMKLANDKEKSKVTIFDCNLCKKSYLEKPKMIRHINIVHKGLKEFFCKLCDKIYVRNHNFKYHFKKVHEGQKVFKCASCDNEFSQPNSLIEHMRISHGKKDEQLNKCEFCKKLFTRETDLKRHIHSIHEGKKDYKCEVSSKSFSHGGDLKKHIHRVHEGNKNHKCESCGKSFSQVGDLIRHIRMIHEGHKDFKCKACGKWFSVASHLRRHIYIVHKEQKDYKCGTCGKSFSTVGYMRQHMHKIHESHRDYKYETCNKSFSETLKGRNSKGHKRHTNEVFKKCHKNWLKRYLKKIKDHANSNEQKRTLIKQGKKLIKRATKIWQTKLCRSNSIAIKKLPTKENITKQKYECCDTSFPDEQNLKIHIMKAQSSEELNKMYKCDNCNKMIKGGIFMLQAHHYREHYVNPNMNQISNYNYKLNCRVCLKSFSQESGLNNHILRKHCYEKRFSCTLCQKQYHDFRKLQNHLNLHSGSDNPYVCKTCSKGYQTPYDLKRHNKSPFHQQKLILANNTDGQKYQNEVKNNTKVKDLKITITDSWDYHDKEMPGAYTLHNNKTFPCQTCGKSFSEFHSLKNHIKIVHEKAKIFSCKLCDESYSDYRDLSRHYKSVHEEQKIEKAKEYVTLSLTDIDANAILATKVNHTILETSLDKNKMIADQERDKAMNVHPEVTEIVQLGEKNNETEKYLEEPKENNVQLEKKSIEYKTYMRCIICKTDIYQTTDAFIHLERMHKISCNVGAAMKQFFVVICYDKTNNSPLPQIYKQSRSGQKFEGMDYDVDNDKTSSQLSPYPTDKQEKDAIRDKNTSENKTENPNIFNDNKKNPEIRKKGNLQRKLSNLKQIEFEKIPMAIDGIAKLRSEKKIRSQIVIKNPVENVAKKFAAMDNSEEKITQITKSSLIESKTKVELSINGNTDTVSWIKVTKPPNNITLIDVTTLLKKQPKMYGLSNEMMYNYRVKITDEEGQIGFEDIDEPNSILPLFGDKIVLQCWSQ